MGMYKPLQATLIVAWYMLHSYTEFSAVDFRPNVEELKSHLKDLGADYVVTEEHLKSSEMKEIVKVSLS